MPGTLRAECPQPATMLKPLVGVSPHTSELWTAWDARGMALTVTYTDGTITDYDEKNWWEVTDGGLLKIGARTGIPDLYVSPGGWSTIQVER